VKYDDPANKALVTEEIRELLRIRRKVRVEQDDNFAIFSPESLTRLWNELTGGLFLSWLLFLLSSNGRRRGGDEHHAGVGDRADQGDRSSQSHWGYKARTSSCSSQLKQWTLCMVGGLLGILVGALLTLILHFAVSFLHASLFSPTWVLVCLWFPFAIGLMFGIYPAWKAASMDPIEALAVRVGQWTVDSGPVDRRSRHEIQVECQRFSFDTSTSSGTVRNARSLTRKS